MRTAAAFLLALAAASARAGDAPPPPDTDSIAAAKRDFDSIKGSTAPAVGGMALPSIDMKDLGPTPGSPLLEAPTPLPTDKDLSLDPTKKKAGTGNWLVDAMEKNKDGTTKSGKPGDDLLKDDADLAADGDKEEGRGGKEAQANTEAREGSGPKETSHVYNPLDSFMGSWISARDHDLLVPSTKGDAQTEGDAAKTRPETPGTDVIPAGSLVDMLLPAPDTAGWTDSKVEANPYIGPTDTDPSTAVKIFSAPEGSGFSPFEPLGPVGGSTSSGVGTAPIDTSRSFVPDFAQPQDDPAFKQMKRF
jgi:hypothetical protein